MLLWKRARLRIHRLLMVGVLFVSYPGNPTAAELPPAPAGSFSMVVLPDTQTYSATKPDVFHAETQWIVDHLDAQRIRFVSHVGDVVDANVPEQWQVAREAMDRLHGRVPYGFSVGNHDMTSAGDSSLFKKYFPASRFDDFPWYAGNHQNNSSSCQLFSAEGLDFVVVHLECNAPDDVLEWADRMLARYRDRQAIVTTHMYLGPRDKPVKPEDFFDAPKDRMLWAKRHGKRGNSPQEMWEKCFEKHANLFMICCGDQSRTQTMHRTVRGRHGNPVHEVLCDYHEGSLRVYRFIPSEDRIQAWTYRPQQGELCPGTPIVPDAEKHHFSLPYKMKAASESPDAAQGRSRQVDNDRVVSHEQARQWRSQIRAALFVPDVLPGLDVAQHGQFTPTPGIVAERVTYATQFGMRVPAVVYSSEADGGKRPAVIVVNGHGGDKYSWYAFYSGMLYAQAGAVVLTYDPIGEGERNWERKSGTRAHDVRVEPREMGQRLGGLMMTDLMQAVSYLSQRPDVDPKRIAAFGYSMGSFVLALGGAVDQRLRACVLAGGGNLDGTDGYWDNSKPMCQGIPYQSLALLGDRAAALYALHGLRGPTLVLNGLDDTVVAIPTNGKPFFEDLQARTARLLAPKDSLFETRFVADASHRPFFVTRPAALWLEQQIDFPNWTLQTIDRMEETHVSAWAAEQNVAMDRGYISEDREGGTLALGTGIPGLSRADLSVLPRDEWEQRKDSFIYETWVREAKSRVGQSQ